MTARRRRYASNYLTPAQEERAIQVLRIKRQADRLFDAILDRAGVGPSKSTRSKWRSRIRARALDPLRHDR